MSPRAERSENKPGEVTSKVLHGHRIVDRTIVESSVHQHHH